jgi:hypothetical protein
MALHPLPSLTVKKTMTHAHACDFQLGQEVFSRSHTKKKRFDYSLVEINVQTFTLSSCVKFPISSVFWIGLELQCYCLRKPKDLNLVTDI